jgi:PAS domain S-box-containing protein
MLAASQEQYRLLAENGSDVIMRLSPERRFEWVSGSVVDVLGWRAPELVGHVIDEFIHPDDLSLFRMAEANARPGSAASVEFRFRHPEGSGWVASRTRVKVDEDGSPLEMVGGLVDISDRKAAESRELAHMEDLEQFHRLAVGRELQMIDLKKENASLRMALPPDGPEPRTDGATA